MDNTTKQIDNFTCHPIHSLHHVLHPLLSALWIDKFLGPVYRQYWPCAALSDHFFDFCRQHRHLYQCINTSKCISRHRILDGTKDCFFGDDEQSSVVSEFIDLEASADFFRCPSSNTFISSRLVADGFCDCPKNGDNTCDDEYCELVFSQTHISFQTICDGFTELKPLLINGQWMTDETDCQDWLCDNVYTRCDKQWNCADGGDEISCNRSSSSIECPSDSRPCLLPDTNDMACLPVDKMNDSPC